MDGHDGVVELPNSPPTAELCKFGLINILELLDNGNVSCALNTGGMDFLTNNVEKFDNL